MAKVKTPSRQQRWSEAVDAARSAIDDAIDGRDRAIAALQDVLAIRSEFEEWRDNLPESLRSSPVGEKLDAVCDIDLEPAEDDLEAIEAAVGEAEGAELPLGFGRD